MSKLENTALQPQNMPDYGTLKTRNTRLTQRNNKVPERNSDSSFERSLQETTKRMIFSDDLPSLDVAFPTRVHPEH
ncbi:hypothetical protein ABFA07_018305 [Porites harrisoni]